MLTVQTWSCDIFQSDGPIWKSDIPSWSLEFQNHFYICNEWINACNAIMIFGVHGWSFQSSSLIKSWVENWVSTGWYRFMGQFWKSSMFVSLNWRRKTHKVLLASIYSFGWSKFQCGLVGESRFCRWGSVTAHPY